MLTSTENPIHVKTRELCQTLLEQPEFQVIREQIDSFFADDAAKTLFASFNDKGELLQSKQSQGLPLSEEEIAGFERERAALIENPITRGFIQAQEAVHQLQESVGKYLAKTFELGRLPEETDFEHGCGCGGCGCGH